jgi:hypothetical protein
VYLLTGFLILLIVLAIVGSLIWCIEFLLKVQIPPPVKVIIAIVLIILTIIWGIKMFSGG